MFSLYDPNSFEIIRQMEVLGLCEEGEGGPFVEDGNIGLDGKHPTNPDGGCLAYAWNGTQQMTLKVVEAVRQLRGTAVNQIPDAETAVAANAGSAAAPLRARRPREGVTMSRRLPVPDRAVPRVLGCGGRAPPRDPVLRRVRDSVLPARTALPDLRLGRLGVRRHQRCRARSPATPSCIGRRRLTSRPRTSSRSSSWTRAAACSPTSCGADPAVGVDGDAGPRRVPRPTRRPGPARLRADRGWSAGRTREGVAVAAITLGDISREHRRSFPDRARRHRRQGPADLAGVRRSHEPGRQPPHRPRDRRGRPRALAGAVVRHPSSSS